MGARRNVIGHDRWGEGRGDRDDHVRFAHIFEFNCLERNTCFLCDLFDVGQHLGVIIPADDFFETALLQCCAQLERGLVARTDHADDLGIVACQVLDRDGGCGSGAQCSQQVATYHRLGFAGIRVEQENSGLVVDKVAFLKVVRPVAASLQTNC